LPIIGVDPIFSEALKPADGLVSQAHLKLKELTGIIQASNFTGIINWDDEQTSGDGVSAWLAVEQRDVS
jgi:hypothetical protein